MFAVHPVEALGRDKLLIENATVVCPHDMDKLAVAVVTLPVLIAAVRGI